jgi:hypothetical protein
MALNIVELDTLPEEAQLKVLLKDVPSVDAWHHQHLAGFLE